MGLFRKIRTPAFLVCLLISGGAFADEVILLKDASPISISIPDEADWGKKAKVVKLPDLGFEFQIDQRAKAAQTMHPPESEAYIQVQWFEMNSDLGHSCESLDPRSMAKQKKLLENAKTDRDAKIALNLTGGLAKPALLRVGDISIAYGIDDCVGDIEDEVKIESVQGLHAKFYRNNRLIEITMNGFALKSPVVFKDYSKAISRELGVVGGPAWRRWKFFKKMLGSIRGI